MTGALGTRGSHEPWGNRGGMGLNIPTVPAAGQLTQQQMDRGDRSASPIAIASTTTGLYGSLKFIDFDQ